MWTQTTLYTEEVAPAVYRNTPDGDLIVASLTGVIAGHHTVNLIARRPADACLLADKMRTLANHLDTLAALVKMAKTVEVPLAVPPLAETVAS